MTFSIVALEALSTTVGGQAAGAQPPSAEDRTRQIIRDEMELDRRMRNNERFRAWERRHPFQALICQGDRDCAGFDED